MESFGSAFYASAAKVNAFLSDRDGGCVRSSSTKRVIVRSCCDSSATQEMEGLNGPDDNRTNSNIFAKSVRGLRTDGSQSGSASEIPQSKGAFAIAKCGQPPQVGFERDLQNGGRRRGQPDR